MKMYHQVDSSRILLDCSDSSISFIPYLLTYFYSHQCASVYQAV